MRLDERPLSFLAIAILCFGLAPSVSRGGQTAPAPASAATPNPAPTANANNTPPLTEEALQSRFVGKMVFLRGAYVGDDLSFDMDGKVNGSPGTTSFTLDAFEIKKIHLTKRKLEFEADRYALHFTGALPYEDASKGYEKVKISKKPVHISIQRELVVIPKVKKEKEKKVASVSKPAPAPSAQPAAASSGQPSAAATGSAVAASTPAAAPSVHPAAAPGTAVAAVTPAAAPVPAPQMAPGTTTSPAHSAMLMNAALDSIFATDIDEKMVAHLPQYWQEYFKSKREHREFTPESAQVLQVGGDVSAPKVLNSIDPSSNEYAQKYGVAGLTLFRTVVDAQGKPQEIAVARPIGFGLDEKAVEAIKASRFTPAVENGHAVPVVIDVVVTFRIYSNRTKPGSVTKKSKETEVVASAWDDSGPSQR